MAKKNILPASKYAPPHTMSGKGVSINSVPVQGDYAPDQLKASVGNISAGPSNPGVKTTGIKMRGAGAATKGTMSRGPMG